VKVKTIEIMPNSMQIRAPLLLQKSLDHRKYNQLQEEGGNVQVAALHHLTPGVSENMLRCFR
jgi:hypothetical protein